MNSVQEDNSAQEISELQNRWVIWIILACALGILLLILITVMTSRSQSPQDYTYSPALRDHDPVAAMVKDTAIYQSDIIMMAQAQGLVDSGAELVSGSLVYEAVLQELIDQRLLSQEAEDEKLEADPVVRHRIQMARERILADAMAQRVLTEATSDKALEKVYNEQAALRRSGTQVSVRQIVVPDKETADYVIELLDKGESFITLAVAYSTDRASRENDGDLGYISKDMLDPILTEIAFKTSVGEMAEPFETDQGWHVIEVIDRRDTPQPSLAEIKEDLARLIGAQALQKHMMMLRTNSNITLNDPQTTTDGMLSGGGLTEDGLDADSQETSKPSHPDRATD